MIKEEAHHDRQHPRGDGQSSCILVTDQAVALGLERQKGKIPEKSGDRPVLLLADPKQILPRAQ